MSRKIRLPAVLRDEPQYRLLFGSQVLSVLGDRVTMVALPFAVLATGGGVAEVALVSAAQFLPFVVLALPAGVWADRWDRKRILIASDAVRLVCQVVAATLLLTDTAHVAHLAVRRRGVRRRRRVLRAGLQRPAADDRRAANIQPANALRGLTFSVGSIVGPVIAGLLIAFAGGPGGALLFDAATFAVSIALLLPLRPRVVDAIVSAEDPAATTDHFWTSLREGWGEVRSRSWVLAFLGGFAAYHVIVLPAIFVIGPVLMEEELDGAGRGRSSWPASASARCSATCSSCAGDRRSRCVSPRCCSSAPPARRRSSAAGSGPGASAALELLAGVVRDRRLHALGDLAGRAHPRSLALAGVELRLPHQRRDDPARQRARRRGQRLPRASGPPSSG